MHDYIYLQLNSINFCIHTHICIYINLRIATYLIRNIYLIQFQILIFNFQIMKNLIEKMSHIQDYSIY